MTEEEFVAAVADAVAAVRLDAVLVGMMAARLQGAPALTQDVDLLVRDTPLNRNKLKRLAALVGGVGPHELSPLSKVLRITGARAPIAILFNEMAGKLRFEGVRARSAMVPVGNSKIRAASLADVIKSKEAAGRPKDLAQLPILRDTLRVKRALEEEP
jgi:hypothetical protein